MESVEKKLMAYYAASASKYDEYHESTDREHLVALHYMAALIKFHDIKSVLDVGAGTGRVAKFLSQQFPTIQIVSVEPSVELRKIAIRNGIRESEFLDGDIYALSFHEASFDLVCAFGVFHHLRRPDLAISEMKRVSRGYLFLSDANNYGQGNRMKRIIKQFLRWSHLWTTYVFIKTKGRKYTYSESDGLVYSFSLVDILNYLKGYSLKFLSTRSNNHNFLTSASHFALFAEKDRK